jgi:hypothetical protein
MVGIVTAPNHSSPDSVLTALGIAVGEILCTAEVTLQTAATSGGSLAKSVADHLSLYTTRAAAMPVDLSLAALS